MSDSVAIKVTFNDTTRRLPSLPRCPPPSFSSLLFLITTRFSLPPTTSVSLKTKDGEGDWITVSSDEELAELFGGLSSTTTTLRFELSTAEVKKELVGNATSTAGTSESKNEVDVEEKTSGTPSPGAVESDPEDVVVEVNEENEQEWTEISAADSSSSPSPNVSSPSTPALLAPAPPSPAVDTAPAEEEHHDDPASPTITPADLASSFSASEFPSSPSSSTFPDELPSPASPPAGSLPFAAVPSAFSHFFSATLTQRGASLSSLLSQPDSALSRFTTIASSLPAIAGTGENPIPAFATAFSAAVKEVAEGVRLEAQEVKDEFDRLRAECDREGKRFEQDMRATFSLKKDEQKEEEEKKKEEEKEEETPAKTEEEAAAPAQSQQEKDDKEKHEYAAYLIDMLKIHFPDKDGKEAPQVIAKRKALEAALKEGSVEVEGEPKREVDLPDSDDDLPALTSPYEPDDHADMPALTDAAPLRRASSSPSPSISSASPSTTLSTAPFASQQHQQTRLAHLAAKEARKRDRAHRRAEKEQKRVEKEMRREEREKKRAAKEKGKGAEAVEDVGAKEENADVVAPSPPSTAAMPGSFTPAPQPTRPTLERIPRPYASTSSSTLPSPPSSPIDSTSPILLTSFLLLCRSTLSLNIDREHVRRTLTGIWFEGKGGRTAGVDALVGRAAEELL